MQHAAMCVAKDQTDVRFAAIPPSGYARIMNVFRVCTKASPVQQLCFLSAALSMQLPIQFLHGKHSCHQGRSDFGHVQSPNARTTGMRRVLMYAAVSSVGVRIAATNSFVKTQTVFRV
jgi:hypothetical protein